MESLENHLLKDLDIPNIKQMSAFFQAFIHFSECNFRIYTL